MIKPLIIPLPKCQMIRHNSDGGGVIIGSLEGSGNAFLGSRNLTVGSNSLSKTFSGVIQDGGIAGGTGGSLTKIGTGALTLTGANTYTGGTTVNDGALFINNTTGSGTGTGNVTVNAIGTAIGTLGGNGTISGAVTVNSGANLAPGPTGNGSTGILNTGAFTLNSGSNFSLDLNGDVAGTSYDQVFVMGAVSITNANLALNLVSGLSVGDQLFILENNGTDPTGTFAGLANGATSSAGGDTFQIFYDANGQGGGNDIELTVLTAVPEPSTWASSVLAFVGLAYTQRRRLAQMLRRA
jgi:autotransporter-associated beta strand protein